MESSKPTAEIPTSVSSLMYVIHIQTVPTTMVDSDVPVTRDGEGLVNIPCVLISTSALKELTDVRAHRPGVLTLLEVIIVFVNQDGGKFLLTSALTSTNVPQEATAALLTHTASIYKARIDAIATGVITNLDLIVTMTVAWEPSIITPQSTIERGTELKPSEQAVQCGLLIDSEQVVRAHETMSLENVPAMS
ncbi:hypothetical protein P5673_004835 [Acropora cervicornis]|uniref:Uncharacterized protein n=1 Tax=Acropora cervicornis TaxID=6130 RepID=A0AAD9QZ63_ACRCE|nr:hypothetical protein P5673_004835 [Acropora cervicornis]